MNSYPAAFSKIRLVAGPAAWSRSEIRQSDTYTYELTRSDIHELHTALRHALSQDLNPAEIAREQFPLGRLGVSLEALRQQLQAGIGFCLIRGIPIERYNLTEAGVLLCG